jgi:hypothetical protein
MNNQGINKTNKLNINEPLSNFINIFAPKALDKTNNNSSNNEIDEKNFDKRELEQDEANANMHNSNNGNYNTYFPDSNNNFGGSNPSFGLIKGAFSHLLDENRSSPYPSNQHFNNDSQNNYANNHNQPINNKIKIMSLMSTRLKEAFEGILAVSVPY